MKIDLGNVLILSPHFDDWFFGCWAFINRASGTILVFSTGAYIGDPDEELRKQEILEARKIVPPFWSLIESQMFMTRGFFLVQDKVQDAIYKAVKNCTPKMMLIPGGRNMDHRVIRELGETVAENSHISVVYYYVNMNSLKPPPNLVVHLTGDEARTKADLTRTLWGSQAGRARYLQTGGDELYRWEEGEW